MISKNAQVSANVMVMIWSEENTSWLNLLTNPQKVISVVRLISTFTEQCILVIKLKLTFTCIYFLGMCFPDSSTLEGLDSIMQYALGKFGRTFKKHLYQDLHSQFRVVDYFAM